MNIRDIILGELARGGKIEADRKTALEVGVTEESAREMGVELTEKRLDNLPDGEMAIVVCVPDHWPTPFDDNEKSNCLECGRGIIHRPGYDERVVKVCTICVMGFDMHAEEGGE